MKVKNLKIGTQLLLGFACMLVFVVLLGLVALFDSNKIHQQTDLIYNHPLKVRRAIGALEADILTMRLGTRDLMLAVNDSERSEANRMIEVAAENAREKFGILKTQYLGPVTHVDEAYNAFIRWESDRRENLKLAEAGNIEKVKKSFSSTGEVGKLRDDMLQKIKIIDDFALNKTDALYSNSDKIKDSLTLRLVLLVASVLLLMAFISFWLIRSIRKPLKEMTSATDQFNEGNLDIRSKYLSGNEFGVLSSSFNSLADRVQFNLTLNDKSASIASAMLGEDDPRKFFSITLSALLKNTNSQMAAVYLLSADRKTFDYFESIGTCTLAKQSFSADGTEGEFGAVLAEKKIIHITNIHASTFCTFPTVSGEFIPRAIVTIPIIDVDKVVAVISISSLNDFSTLSIKLLNDTWAILNARINGVLAFKKILDFSAKLDMQNKELEQQSKEMTMQADELKEYNLELEIQKKQLNEANQLKSAFLSNMSHELRTPLNSVIALSGVLNRRLKNQISDDEYSYLGIIEKNGKQLLSLINDILDLSRIEAGKEETNWSKFMIQQVINGIIDTLSPLSAEKGITLLSSVQEGLPAIVSDMPKLHHILQNIMGNAVKFTEAGSVEVTAELKNGKLQIAVKDTGIGIAAEHLPYIFDEFRQVDGRSSRKFGGTGLGLAIAQKYTKLLHGSIEVSSTEGVGTLFVITLPEKPHYYKNADVTTAISSPVYANNLNPETTNNTVGKTILLVEDSEPQIIQLNDILKEAGYQILVARNGKEALEAIQKTMPDAMILDLMMPEVDGFDVLRSIRSQKETCQIPVLILTAKHVTKEELSFLTSNHVYQLIQKGDVNRAELLAHVGKMLQPPIIVNTAEVVVTHKSKEITDKATIVLIEDNDDNTTTVKALIDGKHHLFTAADGQNGLDLVKTVNPHLILLDISLPGMDGFEVLKAIKNNEDFKHIPVIALTARAMKGDREDLLEYGFDDYISKPIDALLFEKIILAILNRE